MDKRRCLWVETAGKEYLTYHDESWGRPTHDEKTLCGLFIVELFQAGLSWLLLLRKFENFRRAFDGFDVEKIASYGDDKIEELMQDKGIVRNRAKIEAAVNNCKIILNIRKEFGSFSEYLWHFTEGKSIIEPVSVTRDPLSDDIAKDLKSRGMRFCGSVTIFSFLQGVGIIYSHSPECFCYKRDRADEFVNNKYRRTTI